MQSSIQTVLLVVILVLQCIFLWISYEIKLPVDNNLLLIFITVIGWVVVYFLGMRQFKKQMIVERKLNTYTELIRLKEEIREEFSFDLLNYVMFKSVSDETNTETALRYSRDLSEKSYSASGAFLQFNSYIEAWIFLMPNLEMAKVVLLQEFKKFFQNCHKLEEKLRMYPFEQNEIKKIEMEHRINELIKEINSGDRRVVHARTQLILAMNKAGFSAYGPEIWHFNLGNQMDALVKGGSARYGGIEP